MTRYVAEEPRRSLFPPPCNADAPSLLAYRQAVNNLVLAVEHLQAENGRLRARVRPLERQVTIASQALATINRAPSVVKRVRETTLWALREMQAVTASERTPASPSNEPRAEALADATPDSRPAQPEEPAKETT